MHPANHRSFCGPEQRYAERLARSAQLLVEGCERHLPPLRKLQVRRVIGGEPEVLGQLRDGAQVWLAVSASIAIGRP
jgi:hypothetical protein